MRLWTKQLDEGVHDAGIAVIGWYNRLKARPSFQDAIVKWEN